VTRKLNPELEAFLDHKLANFGAAHDAIKNKNPRQLMIYAALACVGIKEDKGANKGKMIQLFTDTVGNADVIPWCMAFSQSIVAYAEVKCGILSPLVATEHVLTCWNSTPKESRVKTFPLPGAIVIWRHGTSSSGHTGVVIEANGSDRYMIVVEGNTGGGVDDGGKIVREGDGCYKTRRPMSAVGNMKLVGFLKPF